VASWSLQHAKENLTSVVVVVVVERREGEGEDELADSLFRPLEDGSIRRWVWSGTHRGLGRGRVNVFAASAVTAVAASLVPAFRCCDSTLAPWRR
jgi:hypothetical protein